MAVRQTGLGNVEDKIRKNMIKKGIIMIEEFEDLLILAKE